jgi:hypothetical protein
MNLEKTKVMRISRPLSSVHIMIDQKQMESVEYFNCLDNFITNDARFTHEIQNQDFHAKSNIQQEEDSFYQQTGLKLKEEISKMLHSEHSFEIWS